MQKSPKRKRPSSPVSILIAGILVVALILAGTLVRMRSREIGFADAFSSFVSDTFNMGSIE